MKHETRLESPFEFGKGAPKIKRPTPRVESEALVVANNFTLPAICVRTGTSEDLVTRYHASSSGGLLMFLPGGPLAFLFGNKRASIRYSVNRAVDIQIRTNAAIAYTIAAISLLSILSAAFIHPGILILVGVFGLLSSVVFYQKKAVPFKVTNIWEGEVYIRNLHTSIYSYFATPDLK